MYQDREKVSNPKDAFPLQLKLFVVSLTENRKINKELLGTWFHRKKQEDVQLILTKTTKGKSQRNTCTLIIVRRDTTEINEHRKEVKGQTIKLLHSFLMKGSWVKEKESKGGKEKRKHQNQRSQRRVTKTNNNKGNNDNDNGRKQDDNGRKQNDKKNEKKVSNCHGACLFN